MKLTVAFIEKLEEEYLRLLVDFLQRGDITSDQAKLITKDFLKMTPFTSSEDMEKKIEAFTMEHPEFGGLYINLLTLERSKNDEDLINQMRAHIKENRLDEALNLVNNK